MPLGLVCRAVPDREIQIETLRSHADPNGNRIATGDQRDFGAIWPIAASAEEVSLTNLFEEQQKALSRCSIKITCWRRSRSGLPSVQAPAGSRRRLCRTSA